MYTSVSTGGGAAAGGFRAGGVGVGGGGGGGGFAAGGGGGGFAGGGGYGGGVVGPTVNVQAGGQACCGAGASADPGCGVTDAACGVAQCGTAVCGSVNAGPAELVYVGAGQGSYKTEYAYAGVGGGEFEYIQPKRPTYCMCWCSLLTLLLLGVLLWLLFGPSTVTTTTPRPLPKCGVFQCPVNFQAKPGSATIVGQDVNICCVKTCAVFQCPAPYTRKQGALASIIGSSVEACCDKTCASYTCATGFTLKTNAATIRAISLTGGTCCDQQACNTFQCPANYLPKPSTGTTLGQDIVSCCDLTCGNFQCTTYPGWSARPNARFIRGHSRDQCCMPEKCDTFQCPTFYIKKAGLISGHDTNACCDITCAHFHCAAAEGFTLKSAASTIRGQSQDICCNAQEIEKKECIVYGDPHSESFDGHHNDFYTTGEYWIIKSNKLKVQGRYKPTHITRGLSVTKEVTISGGCMDNHVLRISATRISYDGGAILTEFPGSFQATGFDVTYNDHGKILQPHRELGKDLKVLHFNFDDGTFIQVNQWTNPEEGFFVNIMIKMSPEAGQDGHCGNFNGNAADDDRNFIRKRMGVNGVAQADLIGFKVKTPIATTFKGYPTISECESHLLISAHAKCQAEEHHFIPSMGCLSKKCHDSKGSLVAA